MVVLHSVYEWLPRTATWVYGQIRSLPDTVEAHVVCERLVNESEFPFPRVHSFSAQPGHRQLADRVGRRLGLRRHLEFAVSTARKAGASLLHSHFGDVAWRNVGLSRQAELRHVATFYGWDMSSLPEIEPEYRNRYRVLFAAVDRVLLEGEHMAGKLVDLGCPREKITVQHLGVDVDAIAFKPLAWKPGDTLKVLMAASFREKKGIPYGIEALARIQGDVDIALTIIGDSDGSERGAREKQNILSALERTGLHERTRLMGYCSHADMLREAADHHVFLSPSVTASDGDTEGGAPVSIIEMSARGMMVVSSRHCDIPGVILDGATGLLAPERDVDALAAHMQWLIANPGAWADMASRGREHIEREFNLRVQGERLAEIYRDCLRDGAQ